MFDELLLHTGTKRDLKRISSHPSQGYLFVGPSGSGKYASAKRLAQHWSGTGQDTTVELMPENKQSISIAQVHGLRERLARRLGSQERRTVIIDPAHALTHEAQNALLKVLEEPPAQTTFVLIADTISSLLPTVRSRLQPVRFPYLRQSIITNYLQEIRSLSEEEAVRAYYIGHKTVGGALQMLITLADAEEAKQFISAKPYNRLVMGVTQLTDREYLLNFTQRLQSIYETLLWQATQRSDRQMATTSAQRLETIDSIREGLRHNGNVRLLTLRLVLEL